jgi:hypothetical protein
MATAKHGGKLFDLFTEGIITSSHNKHENNTNSLVHGIADQGYNTRPIPHHASPRRKLYRSLLEFCCPQAKVE